MSKGRTREPSPVRYGCPTFTPEKGQSPSPGGRIQAVVENASRDQALTGAHRVAASRTREPFPRDDLRLPSQSSVREAAIAVALSIDSRPVAHSMSAATKRTGNSVGFALKSPLHRVQRSKSAPVGDLLQALGAICQQTLGGLDSQLGNELYGR